MHDDAFYLARCLALAERGRHTCRPNPVVGCVIVQEARVVAEGWHAVAGQAHAEVHALQQAGNRALGATVYVSLEPCVHHGRTGPCTDELIAAGVRRVVYGMQDPNPLVAGKGLARLKAAGIEVSGPVLPAEAAAANPGFIKRMTQGLPYVRCKVGMSLDGRTAMRSGESQWITGAAARDDVQAWRARSCAILTGIGTLLYDDPSLTVRLPGFEGAPPLRVVVDSQGRTPRTARLLQQPGPVVLAVGADAEARLQAASCPSSLLAPCTLLAVPLVNGKINLRLLLERLASDWLCNEVLIEAGAPLVGAFLQAGLVDELITYIAPSLLGDQARPLAVLPGLERLQERIALRFIDAVMFGDDCRIRSRVLHPNR